MRSASRFLAQVLLLAIVALAATSAWADELRTEAGNTLDQLEKWLGSGENGKKWSAYLNLPSLRTELAKKDSADPAPIAAVLKQLKSGAAGLDMEPFAKLRSALEAWSQELAIERSTDLAQAATDAEAGFQPISDAQLAESRSKLQTAAAKLDTHLKRLGANGAAWKKYLRWDALQQQLAAQSPDLEGLRSVLSQFLADQDGLEIPAFFDVGTALEQYVNDLSARADDQKEQFATQLKGLGEDLKAYAAGQTNELAYSVGEHLGWLHNARQAGPLVRVIRKRYSHPNLHAKASRRLVAAGIERPLDEITPVRDVILGTDISGTGRTTGKITVELVSSPDKAILDTVLVGQVASRNVGYNGPATIHTTGTTKIAGRKRIVFDEKGLASYPSTATADTRTNIDGISAGRSGRGLVQRVATKRVYQSKREAERIGSDHAAARVRQRVEAEAATQLGKAHWNYLRKIRNPLLRRREFPELLMLSTNPESLLVTGMKANRAQIGAPNDPPAVTVENDLAVQLHESMLNNMAAALLSGFTLTEAEAQQQAIDLLGKLPEQLKSEQDRDPWSITFAKIRPVTVKFGDNTVQITVRGQRYTSGERDFQAMNVTANYTIKQDDGLYRLVRDAELQIEPPNFVKGRTLSGRQIALKTLLEKRFGKLFEPEIKQKGLVLPGRWREAGRLDPKQFQSGGGWLVAAWIESGEPAPPEDQVTQARR
jgi:hypothetical protein